MIDACRGAQEGRAPIHYAAEAGNIDCVELLLKNDADVDVVDNNRQTPLHFAAESAQPRICKAFLNHSASPNAKDRSGNTPLHLAAAHGEAAEPLGLIAVTREPSMTWPGLAVGPRRSSEGQGGAAGRGRAFRGSEEA